MNEKMKKNGLFMNELRTFNKRPRHQTKEETNYVEEKERNKQQRKDRANCINIFINIYCVYGFVCFLVC